MALVGNGTGIQTFTITNSFTIVNANAGSEQSVTIPGLVFGRDHILRFRKKTNQDGLILNDPYVSADNTAKVRLVNATGSNITPTASDTYTVTVLRTESSLPAGACNM